jgi:hypothetical protein
MLVRTSLPLLLLLLLSAPPPATACRPRSGVAVHHTGRALGAVASPTDPDLVGTPWAGPPPGVAERASSVRPQGYASLLALAAEGTAHPMLYHGGGVLAHPITVYYLWYGGWGGPDANAAASATVEHFTTHLGGSPWYGLTGGYVDAKGRRPSTVVRYGGAAYDAYSRGKALSDDAIAAAVVDAIRRGDLPDDPEGVYLVLGSADVDATSGFCRAYCGFHKVFTVPPPPPPPQQAAPGWSGGGNGTATPPTPTPTRPPAASHRFYGYIGDPARCGELCRMQASGPNGPGPADAMVSIIAHELAETVTDPYADAWFDAKGLEGPDKCLWLFGEGAGRTYAAPNGAKANMVLGGRHYLVQANWAVSGGVGRCVIDLN